MTETLATIESLARSLAGSGGFQALEPFADRHGSWEIVFWKNSTPEGLDRFVLLSVTEVGSQYEIELRAGAEQGGRFARSVVEEFGIEGPLAFPGRISQSLERAMAVADQFQEGELVETHLPARFQAQRGASAD